MSAYLLRFSNPVPYVVGTRLQEALVEARLRDRIPNGFLLLQHRPVITLGRRGRRQSLLVTDQQLDAYGIELVTASRGGDATYHGPGQWVLYPILRLDRHTSGARGFLHRLEEVAIRTAGAFGVRAFRREGKAGAWTDRGKIAAIGFHVRGGVSSHGLSLNVAPDLTGFSCIVPCGLAGEPVASLAGIVGGSAPSMQSVAAALIESCSGVFGLALSEWPGEWFADDPERVVMLAATPPAPAD